MSVASPMVRALVDIVEQRGVRRRDFMQRAGLGEKRVMDACARFSLEELDAIQKAAICVDERGHISYNRLHMSRADLAKTRLILPIVARVLSTVLKELVLIGGYPVDVLADLPLLADSRRLPEMIRRESFVA